MDYDYNDRKQRSVYSRKLKAGKRRTYFFDVRETRANDFFLTITETRRRFNAEGYERQKVYIYKEDFNKFTAVLEEAIQHVKTELMPDFDFDHYNHEDEREEPRYRQPRGRSAYNSNPEDERSEPGKEAVNQAEASEATAQPEVKADAPQDSAVSQEQQSDINNSVSTDAEPLEGGSTPTSTENKDDLMNASATSDKLASEEVEKW